MSDEKKRVNRLIDEKSPYLLQHAHNPVDWYPWGEEAFRKAANEDKPVFLSIGYSTCHWCHVMERESFTDQFVAAALNKVFISIKVDREERPDIDSVYMRVSQLMTGGGGWPLTILMTPEKKPFYVDTYIPRENGYVKIGILGLIEEVDRLWRTDRVHIESVAENVTVFLRRSRVEGRTEIDESTLTECYRRLLSDFDDVYGGFGRQPKFPIPHQLIFLMRYWKRSGEKRALDMAEKTLRSIRMGGIYDHVEGGVHRYSTDRMWLVPHFEKMLYDQALIVMACVEAYQATGNLFYMEMAKHILEFVLFRMRSPEGGFYSAFDAESEGEEGKFYLWTTQEIEEALGDEAWIFIKAYNLENEGNYIDAATGRRNRLNILHITKSVSKLSKVTQIEEGKLRTMLDDSLEKLRQIRNKRIKPGIDDKILAGWNGLMISALSMAGRVLNEPRYVRAAEHAAGFILRKMIDPEGRLLRRYRDGEALIGGFSEDYAYVAQGLLELYSSTFDTEHLLESKMMTERLISDFWDTEYGGIFNTGTNSNNILVKLKDSNDGALPSANSVACMNLIYLSRILSEPHLELKTKQILSSFSSEILMSPTSYCYILLSLERLLDSSMEIIIVGDRDELDTKTMIKALNETYAPNKIVISVETKGNDRLFELANYLRQYKEIDGKATAYVCRNYICQQPTTDVNRMLTYLEFRK